MRMSALPVDQGILLNLGLLALRHSERLSLNTPGVQLKQVARIIQVRSGFGVRRQIFFASLGAFDSHQQQLNDQSNNLN